MPYEALLRGRWSQAGRAYFITTVTHGRVPVFENFLCARAVIAEMRHLQDRSALLSLSWVLMPDHLHWLLQLSGREPLSEILRLFKGRSALAVNRFLRRRGRLWQSGYQDRAVRDGADLQDLTRYIVANPLRKRLVEDIGAYPHWDAMWL